MPSTPLHANENIWVLDYGKKLVFKSKIHCGKEGEGEVDLDCSPHIFMAMRQLTEDHSSYLSSMTGNAKHFYYFFYLFIYLDSKHNSFSPFNMYSLFTCLFIHFMSFLIRA